MADFEDSLSPSWRNVVQGQQNCIDSVRRTITLDSGGKSYRLNEKTAVLLVRPRGWHLPEKHVTVDGKPIAAASSTSASTSSTTRSELLDRGHRPVLLPARSMESHLEARLWNDVFVFAQETLEIPRGSVRATVLIETLPAAFEMEEILYELREHASGLNAGRWDYIFSRHQEVPRTRKDLLPAGPRAGDHDRAVHARLHRAAGAAPATSAARTRWAAWPPFIPSRKDPEVNEKALAQGPRRQEARGRRRLRRHLGGAPRPRADREGGLRPEAWANGQPEGPAARGRPRHRRPAARSRPYPTGKITEAGLRNNIDVALQYLDSWLLGNGAVAIYNLMEDAATAEISRAQLWQWMHNGAQARRRTGRDARTCTGRPATRSSPV